MITFPTTARCRLWKTQHLYDRKQVVPRKIREVYDLLVTILMGYLVTIGKQMASQLLCS